MMNFREPIYRLVYQQRTISVFCWGDERLFFAQMNDTDGSPIGAAPKLYDTVDAAVNVCKDLLDFLYGYVDNYQERPEPKSDFQPSAATVRQTARLSDILDILAG